MQAHQVQIVRLSTDFRLASSINVVAMANPPPAGTVIVRVLWCGINASDINFRCARHHSVVAYAMCAPMEVAITPFAVFGCSSGRYHGSKAAAEKLLPFGAGFEAVGTCVAAASDVQSVPSLRLRPAPLQ